jgi:hypothetical protein
LSQLFIEFYLHLLKLYVPLFSKTTFWRRNIPNFTFQELHFGHRSVCTGQLLRSLFKVKVQNIFLRCASSLKLLVRALSFEDIEVFKNKAKELWLTFGTAENLLLESRVIEDNLSLLNE